MDRYEEVGTAGASRVPRDIVPLQAEFQNRIGSRTGGER
jgi:hypothetical protein